MPWRNRERKIGCRQWDDGIGCAPAWVGSREGRGVAVPLHSPGPASWLCCWVWEVVKLARNVLNYLSGPLLGCPAVELTVPFN